MIMTPGLASALTGALMTLAGAGLAFAAPLTTPQSQAPLRCAIVYTQSGGMTTLEAVVEADRAISGTYRLAVDSRSGDGSSQINQGGGFSVPAGGRETLGTLSVNKNARNAVTYELTVDGSRYACAANTL